MTTRMPASVGASAARIFASSLGPRIALAPENEDGGGQTPEEIAAATAAAAAATAEALAAEEAETARLADEAEAEAARLAEEEKNLTETEKANKKLLRETMARKAKITELEALLETSSKELKKFEGIDLTEVQKLLKEKTERERSEAEQRGEFERVKAMMIEEAKKDKDALQATIDELRGQIGTSAKTIDALTIGNEFATSTFIREDLVLTPVKARQLYGAHFELKDGTIVAYDKPAGAEARTPLTGADGKQLGFNEAMKKIIDGDPDRESLVKVKTNPGAASRTTNSQTKTNQDLGLSGRSIIVNALNKRNSNGK
ncbi:DUF6651 domain-containing protein [Phyllobacterium myrsinacearum]|uniref:DUF6651 domain-containing protein n=1 Tax=Phyllobacterium myrsinacearum TaxID=28101 RepID=A0A839ES10_9HYPH|nr:DUF6651 domain-containing protein [Phyllobacterium myrsinacearum]MBA8881719.1 hypothetical protein [Phyllobacterium myrsinacearum]